MIEQRYYAYGKPINNKIEPPLSYGTIKNPKALDKDADISKMENELKQTKFYNATSTETAEDPHYEIKKKYSFKNLTEAVQKINEQKDIYLYAGWGSNKIIYIQIDSLLGYQGKNGKGIRGWLCRQQVKNFYSSNDIPCNGYVFLIDPESVEKQIIINGNNFIKVYGTLNNNIPINKGIQIGNPFILGKKVYLYDYGEMSAIECVKANKVLKRDIISQLEGEPQEKEWSAGQQITNEDIAKNHAYLAYTEDNKITLNDYDLRPEKKVVNQTGNILRGAHDEPVTEEISFEEILVGKQVAPMLRQYKSMKLLGQIPKEQKDHLLKNPIELEKKQLEIINKDIVEDNAKQLDFKYDNGKIKLNFRNGEMLKYIKMSAGDMTRYNTMLENKKKQEELQQKINEQQKTIEDQRKAYSNNISGLMTQFKNSEKQHKKDIEQSQKERDETINKIKAEKDAQIKNMQKQTELQIAKEKDDANKKVNDMQNAMNQQITQAKHEASETIKKMQEDNEQKLKDREADATQKLKEANNRAQLAEYDYEEKVARIKKKFDDDETKRRQDFEQEKEDKIKNVEQQTRENWFRENGDTLSNLNSQLNKESRQIYQLNTKLTMTDKEKKELEQRIKQLQKNNKNLSRERDGLRNEINQLKSTTSYPRVVVKKITPLNSSSFDNGSSGGYAPPPPPIDPNYDPLIITSNNQNQEEEEENNVTNNQNTTPQKKSWLVSAIGTLIGVPLSIVGGLGVGDVIEINKGLSIGILAVGAGTAIICIAYDALRTEKPDKQTANNNSTPNTKQNTTPAKPVNNGENIDNNLNTNNGELLEVPMI